MNYLQSVWHLEDKWRVVAIVAIACIVLVLAITDSVVDANAFREHGESHMH